MKLRYIGKTDLCCLINGKEYECLGEENGLYRVIDEEGSEENEELSGYLYEKHLFEVID